MSFSIDNVHIITKTITVPVKINVKCWPKNLGVVYLQGLHDYVYTNSYIM